MIIALAPMDGITDCAYRTICKQVFEKRGNPDDSLMLWTEFMSADGYYHNPPGVIKHLLKTNYEPELIAQIFGGNEETLLHCAQDIDKKYDFAGIELNMGCPSPKIMKCEAGSGTLKNKQKSLTTLQKLSNVLHTPLSLKTRIGLHQDDIDEQFDFLIEASKYVRLITIHGRTYGQRHSGEVNRDFIYNLKAKLPNKLIIGNGGIRSYQQAQDKIEHLDGIMIGQSAIGNPRIFTPHTPSTLERLDIIKTHLNLSCAIEIYFNKFINNYKQYDRLMMPILSELKHIEAELPHLTGDTPLKSPIEFRKYLFNYISGLPHAKSCKQIIAKTKDYHSLIEVLDSFFQNILN